MIPPQLLADAQAAKTFHDHGPTWQRAIEFIFSRLQALSAEGFDSESTFQASLEYEEQCKTLPPTSQARRHGFNDGARHQHALDMAALLELEEEIAQLHRLITARANDLVAERARAEKLENYINDELNRLEKLQGEKSLTKYGEGSLATIRGVRQALGESK